MNDMGQLLDHGFDEGEEVREDDADEAKRDEPPRMRWHSGA